MRYDFLLKLPQHLWVDGELFERDCSSFQGISNLTKMNKAGKYLLMFWKPESKLNLVSRQTQHKRGSNMTTKGFEVHDLLDFLCACFTLFGEFQILLRGLLPLYNDIISLVNNNTVCYFINSLQHKEKVQKDTNTQKHILPKCKLTHD